MRVHYAALLGIVVVATSTSTSILAKDSTLDVSVRSVLGVQVGASTNRFLRIHDATEDKTEERMFNMVTNLMSNKISSGNYVDDLFQTFKLNVPNTNVFENPAFLKWAQSVDDFNLQNADKAPKSMLPTLARKYETIQLSNMLEAAKKVESTRDVATRLQNEQMKLWKNGGLTTDQLFTAYKLNVFDDELKNLLANPGVNVWIKYADEFNPGEKTTLFDTLRKTYPDDKVLSKVLTAGMKDPKTKILATELQAKLVNRWLDDLQPPENVFTLLSLHKGAANVLANPQLRTWIQYAERYKKNNPFTTKLTLFDALEANYLNRDLVKMIRFSQISHSKRARMYAYYVLDGLLGKWAREGRPLRKVLKKLYQTPENEEAVELAYKAKLLDLASKKRIVER